MLNRPIHKNKDRNTRWSFPARCPLRLNRPIHKNKDRNYTMIPEKDAAGAVESPDPQEQGSKHKGIVSIEDGRHRLNRPIHKNKDRNGSDRSAGTNGARVESPDPQEQGSKP